MKMTNSSTNTSIQPRCLNDGWIMPRRAGLTSAGLNCSRGLGMLEHGGEWLGGFSDCLSSRLSSSSNRDASWTLAVWTRKCTAGNTAGLRSSVGRQTPSRVGCIRLVGYPLKLDGGCTTIVLSTSEEG
ncbi:p13 [Pelargonium line pattern virus]|uniref:p13 n=1 Tax=Pelargonium line pattern virus TaxID=167019 RepID=Q56TK8_9TOMB|nr:p13 [Pelargonium line pattern virus]AAU84999.1 p13 [Pelargonium line pattern virus]